MAIFRQKAGKGADPPEVLGETRGRVWEFLPTGPGTMDAEKRADHARLTRLLTDTEAELNGRVYRLFDLTPEEIALLQTEVKH